MRKCNKCKQEKPLTKFYKRSLSATPYMATPEARYEKVCKECRKSFMSDNFRRYNYGLTQEEYQAKLEEQNHCCAICGEKGKDNTKNGTGTLHVDHNHITGNIRGLLCRECNLAIGHLKDSVSILMRAIRYLEIYQ